VDFDYLPEIPGDEWAGSYHSVALSDDGTSLHIAFVRWDERNQVHPLYGRPVGLMNRYDLYYVRLDLSTEQLYNINGEQIERPLNRRMALNKCLVWDTGHYLTNMPSILIDARGYPQFLVPVSGEELDQCGFWFIRWEANTWRRYGVTETTNIWNESHLEYKRDGSITAFLIASAPHPGNLPYGGGVLQEWHSTDHGERWRRIGEIAPAQGWLFNNPKPVEDTSGTRLPRTLQFFGWEGPDGITPESPFRGRAYLWRDGTWL
jgi:hypothetical protein